LRICDFNTYARQEQQIPAYVTALCQEATYVGAQAPDNLILHTIFFGGGTPSLLSPAQIGAILQSIYDAFAVTAEAEITLEANPGTVSFGVLQSLRRGINRLSLGSSPNGRSRPLECSIRNGMFPMPSATLASGALRTPI
jgi:oxygen-independent coproporphyrinogen-3 oxidase